MGYLYELPNSTTGADEIITQTASAFPGLSPLILFFVFLIVFIGGITRQKSRTGTADYSAWAVIGSIATLLIALLFSVNAGFIRLDWLLIVLSLNILSGIWFFLDRKVSEI